MENKYFLLFVLFLNLYNAHAQVLEWSKFKKSLYNEKGVVFFDLKKFNELYDNHGEKKCGVNIRSRIYLDKKLSVLEVMSYLGESEIHHQSEIKPEFSTSFGYNIQAQNGCLMQTGNLGTNYILFYLSEEEILSVDLALNIVCTNVQGNDLNECKWKIPKFRRFICQIGTIKYSAYKEPDKTYAQSFMNLFKGGINNYECCKYSNSFSHTSPKAIRRFCGKPSFVEKRNSEFRDDKISKQNILEYKYEIYVPKDTILVEKIPYNRHMFREEKDFYVFPISFIFKDKRLIRVNTGLPLPVIVESKKVN
jgi:hypothetical protein